MIPQVLDFVHMRHILYRLMSGGPMVVVSTAAFHARVRGSVPGSGGLKETKNVSSPSMCERQYCGEPPWPRGSVLGLRPPGLEFRILCLEDSVISSSHHLQEVLLVQFSLYVHKGGLKPDSFHFICIGYLYKCDLHKYSTEWIRPLCFFLCFRWARALDLGRALPKKHVFFSAQRAYWIVANFWRATFNFGRKKTFKKKQSHFKK